MVQCRHWIRHGFSSPWTQHYTITFSFFFSSDFHVCLFSVFTTFLRGRGALPGCVPVVLTVSSYLKNCWTFHGQTVCASASWLGGVSCDQTKRSVTSLLAECFVTRLSMPLHHWETECFVTRLNTLIHHCKAVFFDQANCPKCIIHIGNALWPDSLC